MSGRYQIEFCGKASIGKSAIPVARPLLLSISTRTILIVRFDLKATKQ